MGNVKSDSYTPSELQYSEQTSKNSTQINAKYDKNITDNKTKNSKYNPNLMKNLKATNQQIRIKTKMEKIIKIQTFFRSFVSKKKFAEKIELLKNILELDSTVNLIKDPDLKNYLLSTNKGENLSNLLIQKKIILPYQNTNYYKTNLKKYKLNKYLIETPLTYIDKYKNKNMYIGTWTLEKKFHGYGVFYIKGNKYEGFWNYGKLKGYCRYYLNNGDYFIGDFKNGQANGYGKYFHHDGTIYEGDWSDDQPNGKGKEVFMDGSFKGIFKNGTKIKGIFQWNDGSFYEGEIKNNNFEGNGKFHWKEGREYIGEWLSGKMHGNGVMSYLDGSKYEGEFVKGKREGYGIYKWNENKFYKGGWLNGKQHGNGFYYNKGKGINGRWQCGTLLNEISEEKNNNSESTNFDMDDNIPDDSLNNNHNSMYDKRNKNDSYRDCNFNFHKNNDLKIISCNKINKNKKCNNSPAMNKSSFSGTNSHKISKISGKSNKKCNNFTMEINNNSTISAQSKLSTTKEKILNKNIKKKNLNNKKSVKIMKKSKSTNIFGDNKASVHSFQKK